MAKAKNKPLSFSTTMRNPERIAGFLSQLVEFENEILTTDVIYKIISNVIKNKLYYTMYEYRNPILKNIYESDELNFTDQQVKEIISNSPQNHKEAGFESGWESRFDTWFQLPEEFGFVLYEKNKKLKISKLGHMLIDAYNQEDTDEKQIQSVFLNCLCKYQSNNPFKKNLNSNVPLLLLLKTIKLLKED
ncbi:MAG: AlwI family type II restriction endonuclease, partial [Clostridia bacterium]